jgi:apolipoprotein D and lipocalin family protein
MFYRLIFLSLAIMETIAAQKPVTSVNVEKYSGKWYVVACIPTRFDKNWEYITESYNLNKKGHIGIYTTYKIDHHPQEKSLRSKGFPVKGSNNTHWKVQFVWPFKADYLIEELAEDYSYVVVGHPKKKFLYIMNRTGRVNHIQYEEILDRAVKRGYNLAELRKIEQGF